MKNKLLLICLLPLLALGCAALPDLPRSPAPPPFAPLTAPGIFPLSLREAESLARRLTPAAQNLRSWRDLDPALARSLAFAASRPAQAPALDQPGLRLTYGELAGTLRRLRALLPRLDASPGLLARDFAWYRLGPDFSATGYYEPLLRAAAAPSAAYPHPQYRRPPDLRPNVPYYTRQDIDRRHVLAGRGLELAWVESETEAFFLQIQGSGRLIFPDGSLSHVLFAGGNNRPYRSLGRILREKGLLAPDEISMFSLRRVLEENPGQRAALLDQNPSYIFFRLSADGPYGSMGHPLTPWVSLASDRGILPHGLLLFLILALPGDAGDPRPFHALALPQDTGSAIRGHRLDLFCGSGREAESIAARLNAPAAVHILIARDRGKISP
ncbi:MAG: MltA domain-containing protein [Desulfovibrio sp.]|jgi:membrane-bound lytic murein transglycosylase A|nr:MltA domain-containing protein [Desulfovibrio sp.]